jgi:tRNA(Phe) wybutosine-synthesizing methylase Tyw3
MCAYMPSVVAAAAAPLSPLPEWFAANRLEILHNIEHNQKDKSLAGGVDPLIRPLVDFINRDTRYVTLSSCSGRYSLFHRVSTSRAPASRLSDSDQELEGSASKPSMKRGAGLGTLYQTHDPFDADRGADTSAELALQALAPLLLPGRPSVEGDELLQLKFEPMILHVMCSGLEDAVRLLNAANDAGLRRSGILAVSRRAAAQPSSSEGKYTVNLTSALHFDVPVMVNGRWCVADTSSMSELRHCFRHWAATAAGLFAENTKRMGRLEQALQRSFAVQ